MRKNPLKEKLRAGESILGPIMGFNAPILVDIFAYAGFDFVVFDAEHGPLSEETCESLVRAAEAVGIAPIVRCPQNVPQVVLRFLDSGTLGVHIPQINSAQEAMTAVRAVKYHPLGQRGLAGIRALGYGVAGSLSEQIEIANRESMLIAHIESVQAVRNVRDLAAVEGIDVYFIGPTDLSQSLGVPGQFDHPDLAAAIDSTIAELRSAGRVVGILARNPEESRRYIEKGVQYIITGASGLIMSGSRGFLQKAR